MAAVVSVIGGVVLAGLGLGAVVYLGWWLAISGLRRERSQLQTERTALDAEWQALDNTRRVRAVFLAARRAMQREAQAHYHRGEPS